MSMKTDREREMAEAKLMFLLKGGKVTKVASDKPKRLTDKQWYRHTRDHNNERVERGDT